MHENGTEAYRKVPDSKLARPQVLHLRQDLKLLAAKLDDLAIHVLDDLAVDEHRVRIVSDHRSLLDLHLPLLERQHDVQVEEVVLTELLQLGHLLTHR